MKELKLLVLLLLPFAAFSQNGILQKVQQSQNSGERSTSYEIFKNVTDDLQSRSVDQGELRRGLAFSPDFSQMDALRGSNSNMISLSMPHPDRGSVNLTLVKQKLLRDDFILNTSSFGEIKFPAGSYYHGVIDGDPGSLVALSFFEGEMMGFVSSSEGNVVIGKLQDEPFTHVIYNDKDLLNSPDFSCETPDDDYNYRPEDFFQEDGSRDVGDCIDIYIEIDNDIVNNKGGATGAANFISGLFAQVSTLYANDLIEMGISEIYAWTSTSPYSSTSSSGMLSDFQNSTGAFNGDLAHLVSYQASGGIAAGFDGICNSNPDLSKCFSSIDGSYSNVPTYSWSVMVTTHEMGHLIGSRHTHACVWNGNNTAIDGCAGSTEGSCPLPGNPSGGGTIMSYCHVTSVGINLANGFGPQPGNVVRGTVQNANCLSANCSGGGPTCFDGEQNGNETGVDCGGDCDPCPVPCTDNELTLTIVLDNYPEETSWTVTDDGTGGTVASGGTYGGQADGSTVVEDICIPNGCYTFTISDTYGDGICCSYGNGSYVLVDGSTTLASGGQFGSSEATPFCLGGGPAPTCTDGVQNGNETGVDCGGPDCAACPTCTDGIQNGSETDVDCGGPDCPACPTCTDGVQNGNETGIDCGGPDCPACPTCNDGVQNGSETGVDCGGPDCPACPTCNDGVQNGNETDVDCGGSDCPACPTCSDGVQNGNETGVDCGGPDCAACPTGCSDNDLDLTIVLDNYPGETTWTITADGGGTVASGGPYSGAGSTVVEDLC
ncbi:MAG: hypothetical protein HKN16_07020, partial [Saprospiraceae bacterium]|nr:hypothetical protein [Saprospiraceae bacterium]